MKKLHNLSFMQRKKSLHLTSYMSCYLSSEKRLCMIIISMFLYVLFHTLLQKKCANDAYNVERNIQIKSQKPKNSSHAVYSLNPSR